MPDTIQKTPSYYIRQRLFANKPAMIGLALILLAHAIALLGYLIMPDDTPYATDGSVLIQKKTPGFRVQVLKYRKNLDVDKVSFLEKVYKGQPSEFTITPLSSHDSVRIVNDTVYFVPYSSYDAKNKTVLSYSLISCVKPLFVGTSEKLGKNVPGNVLVRADSIYYVDINEEVQVTTRKELEEEFYRHHLETRTYLLGTDRAGRDILSMLLFGTRISLSIGFIAVLISLFVGVLMGAMAGFFGGRTDALIMWLMTVVWSIPNVMLVIVISLVMQSKGIWVAFLAVGLTMWVDIARVVRGQILSIKQKTFIEAARAFGFSNRRIILKHILPNLTGSLIVISTSNFASAILVEAGLSFLGLGVTPPMPSWGVMINDGFQAFNTKDSWHLVVLPSLSISVMVLAFNLFGNGLRDAYDPNTKK